MYTNTRYGWEGLGVWGWVANQAMVIAGLVSRVCLYAIWMGGVVGVGDGLPMVSKISL